MHVHPELDFDPISLKFAENFIRPFKNYFHPEFFGIDEVDATRPAMYVSNHSVLGVLDVYPFAIELYLRKGIMLRALADSNHYRIPIWKEFITKKVGVLEASRENCAAVMERGENLVVYPGGAREVCRKKGEAYELKWQDRNGFVRMAMKYGYDIIPVAAVGAEEAYTIVIDANDILNHSAIGKLLKMTGIAKRFFKNGELLPPIVRGVGPTIMPRPEKLYFSFGKRISTKRYKSKYEDHDTQMVVKGRVEKSLHSQFGHLFKIRDKAKAAAEKAKE